MDELRPLVGQWEGEGSGRYPTIDSFRYRERLVFVDHPGRGIITYEQSAVLFDTDEDSHWEAGVVRMLEDGTVEFSNAQDSGRVEVLRGKVPQLKASSLRLELDSVVLDHDERMIQSRRIFELNGNKLRYEVQMATRTTETPLLQTHLMAELRRVDS